MATHLFLAGLERVEQGQLARASKAFLDAASVNREIHDQAALRWCLAGLAMAEAMSGHTERAAAAAAEREELPAGSMLAYEPDLIERGRAWLSVATGELSQACDGRGRGRGPGGGRQAAHRRSPGAARPGPARAAGPGGAAAGRARRDHLRPPGASAGRPCCRHGHGEPAGPRI